MNCATNVCPTRGCIGHCSCSLCPLHTSKMRFRRCTYFLRTVNLVPNVRMNAYERAVFDCMSRLHSMTRNYVRTSIIAGMLCKDDRIIRSVLVRLETRGIVQRKGLRGGWRPTRTTRITTNNGIRCQPVIFNPPPFIVQPLKINRYDRVQAF